MIRRSKGRYKGLNLFKGVKLSVFIKKKEKVIIISMNYYSRISRRLIFSIIDFIKEKYYRHIIHMLIIPSIYFPFFFGGKKKEKEKRFVHTN